MPQICVPLEGCTLRGCLRKPIVPNYIVGLTFNFIIHHSLFLIAFIYLKVLGISGSQWTTEECTRFSSDVEGKPFVAIIVEESQDTLFADQIPIFNLVLIDTSDPNKDRYVHQTYARKRS